MSKDRDRDKELARVRKQRFRQLNHCYNLSIPKDELPSILKRTEHLGYTIPEYVKHLIFSDVHGTGYVVPSDNKIQELSIGIRLIGNNINQLTRYIHSEKRLGEQQLLAYQKLLRHLEESVIQTLTEPRKMRQILEEYLNDNPNGYGKVLEVLDDYKSNRNKVK